MAIANSPQDGPVLAELEAANEPQWIVWLDAAGEAEWAAAELAAYWGAAARAAQ